MPRFLAAACLLSLLSCGTEPPRKVADLGGDVPFHLVVSNQSFDIDPVDIEVYVDGVHVITGEFEVGSQHSWFYFDFLATSGARKVRAVSKKGAAELEVVVDLQRERWGVLNYWYYPDGSKTNPPTPRQFSWSEHDQRPAFD